MSGNNGYHGTLLDEMRRIQVESSFEAEDDSAKLGESLLHINDIATAAINTVEAIDAINFTEEDKKQAIAMVNAEKMVCDPKANIKVQEVMERFALIVYDIPATKEGNQARNDFLQRARYLGVVMHTESVYIAPWAIVNELALFKAADVGKVRIFISVPLHKEDAAEITRDYDIKLNEAFKDAEERFDKIEAHLVAKELGMVNRMLPKSEEQVASLKKAAIARGSQTLYERWETLHKKLAFTASFFPKVGD